MAIPLQTLQSGQCWEFAPFGCKTKGGKQRCQERLKLVRAGKKLGPRIEESLSDAIIRIRTENGWGYTKIIQALNRYLVRIPETKC